MRVAALYDIHGNLPALEAVLDEGTRESPDAIVVGGDVVWGPLQTECVELLQSRSARFLAGNCERNVLAPESDRDRWCQAQLAGDLQAEIAAWPPRIELDVDGIGPVCFCHATPRRDDEIVTALTPDGDVAEAMAGSDAALVVSGHTHVRLDRSVPGAPRFLNPGSVGLPYEGERGAFWALLGPGIELRRTSYDVERALERLAAAGFPDFDDIFPEALRGEVAPSSAVEYFESQRRGS